MVLALIAFIVLSMVVDAAVYANKIHGGITIAGKEVSGLGVEEATAAVTDYVREAQGRSVTLISGESTWEVTPESIDLVLDVDAAVLAALAATRDGNVFVDQARKLALYFGDRDIKLAGSFDQTKVDAIVHQVAAATDRPAVDAGVNLTGITLEATPAQDGITVDRQALSEQLVQALCRLDSSELEAPLIVEEPAIGDQAAAAALEQAQTLVGAPLTLTSLEQSWTFSVGQVALWLDFETETDGGKATLLPYLSTEKMLPMLEQLAEGMSPTPVDARFEGNDTRAWVVPAVPGRVLDVEETAEALSAAATSATERTVEALVALTEPQFTTEEAEAMGITDLLSVRTTEWIGTTNRQHNVRLTTEYIHQDGKCLLAPGEEFSFLDTVGPRTPERGYEMAQGIQPNGTSTSEYGGGICQVATTLFNSAFFAGLDVTERRNHSVYVSHYPEGRDAAVTTDEVDLRFINSTDNYIWIRGESSGTRTTFWIYGTNDGREVTYRNSGKVFMGPEPHTQKIVDKSLPPGKTVVVSDGQRQMRITITRWITWPDGTVQEDAFVSNFPRRMRIIRVGPSY